jgi:apolipoprotein N-acyltransferase
MSYLAALVGAALGVLAFPPVGWWPLVVVGPALWLWGLRRLESPGAGARVSLVFGLSFFGGLIWWLSELGPEAVIALVTVQALYGTLFGWALVRWGRRLDHIVWWIFAAGLWAAIEFIRYRFPVGGFEWGAWGYALSDQEWARNAARWIGTSGWTVLVMGAAAGLASLKARRWWALTPVGLVGAATVVGLALPALPGGIPVSAAIVQGSTPCPFVHCPDERLLTYLQHLALTRTIVPGLADLVVWSEGSTGSSNADPVNNPEVGEAIGAEAERLGAWMLVGGDRPVSDTEWINANVVFDPTGSIVGEYRKQHPVPFGEYIPARPLFEWIPALDQVPRDMIRGEGEVLFDLGGYQLGSIISFEGGFARYAREMANLGADLIVVATNEGSYGFTPASDQFIGMTRMRSAETGLDVIHAAVTGKSVMITDGGVLGDATGLATLEVLYGTVEARPEMRTVYVRLGEWVMLLAALGAAVVWTRSRLRSEPEA